jgi:hypothetical protein
MAFVKNYLDELGMTEYFITKSRNLDNFKFLVKNRLHDQFVHNWNISMFNFEKCLVYRTYQIEHSFEKYLDILPINLAIYMCKFRTMNHNFSLEKGRYSNIERADRICDLCTKNCLGDEFHDPFECTHFSNDRKKYIQRYYVNHPSSQKFNELINCKNKNKLIQIALCCKLLLQSFK